MGFNIQQYEMGDVYSNGDSWSNATGYTKEELISKIRDAKDSIEKMVNERNSAQVSYDEANGRNCAKDCSRKKNCHSECWSKDRDKGNAESTINSRTLAINTATANISVWQNELEGLIEKEGNTSTLGGGGAVGGGAVTGATPEKSNTLLYASIGGAVLILGVVGYFVFKKD